MVTLMEARRLETERNAKIIEETNMEEPASEHRNGQ